MSQSSSEELSKIGAIYGVYFLVQAYGYSDGLSDASTEFTITKAVISGFRHLTHFFRPWDGVAWPLTPVLGIFLLLFTLYLPEFLAKHDNGLAKKSIRIYLSFLSVFLFYGLAVGILGGEWAVSIVTCSFIDPPEYPVVLSAVYFLSTGLMVWLFYKFVFNKNNVLLRVNGGGLPWHEILRALLIGLILMSVYLGSEFDGVKDRHSYVANKVLQPKPEATPFLCGSRGSHFRTKTDSALYSAEH